MASKSSVDHQTGNTSSTDSYTSGSGSSSSDDSDEVYGEEQYGEAFYGERDYGKGYEPGKSSGQLLQKGKSRFWFERKCIASYHDRRNPELRSMGCFWVLIWGSFSGLVLRDIKNLKASERDFYFGVDDTAETVFLAILYIDMVLTTAIFILCFVYSFGASSKCPLLMMSSKRIKKTKTKELVSHWFKPFIPWLLFVALLLLVDALSLFLFPYTGNNSVSELRTRLQNNPQVMKDMHCCGVLGVELDYANALPPNECSDSASGCKLVIESKNSVLIKYPILVAVKMPVLLLLLWFTLDSIIGDPTDQNGENYVTHGKASAKKEASDDEGDEEEEEDDD